jgi:predicted N-acetyltransferase YhbS
MVSIVEHVPPDGCELIACLAGLYVAPAWRRQGVGACLCQRALLEARRLGHAKLSLYTPDQEAFYARLGWVKSVETVVETGDPFQMDSSTVRFPQTPSIRNRLPFFAKTAAATSL